MQSPKCFLTFAAATLIGIGAMTLPQTCNAETIARELIVVPSNKLPQESRQPGVAMDLHLVAPQTLYLYVEEQDGRQIAIYDVSDPHKINLKKVAQLAAPAPFDFIQAAGSSLELIRYRDGRGDAMLDLSKPKEPRLMVVGSATGECYIVPSKPTVNASDSTQAPVDYEIFTPTGSQPLMTIRNVIQRETDAGNGTTYLLGKNGLTVIRNIKAENRLAATAPAWSNTIDDN